MDTDPRAPDNQLRSGITAEMMEEGVARSGYPLQTEVALVLMKHMEVREEWSYPDRDTKKLRAVDIMAIKMLDESATVALPRLSLLVECKRSELPYVFFRAATDSVPYGFPEVYGLDGRHVSLAGPTMSTEVSAGDLLGLQELPFAAAGPPVASTFARAEGKEGKSVKLSGVDPFNSVVMPLIAAMDHAASYFSMWKPEGCAPTLTLGICVLDAPMVLADARTKPHELTLAPWVRVVRQEVVEQPHGRGMRLRFYAVDIVHFSFLEAWVNDHLLPFAATFRERVERKKQALRHGARVKDIQNWNWSEVEAQEPRQPQKR